MITPQVSALIHFVSFVVALLITLVLFGFLTNTSRDANERFTGWTRALTLLAATAFGWIVLDFLIRVVLMQVL